MRGGLYAFISLLGVVGGCSLRSRILQLPANGQVVFRPDPTELADYMLLYAFRGSGVGSNVRWQLTQPPTGGLYDIVSDDYEVALGGSRDTGIEVTFTNLSAVAFQIEVYMARFNEGQLADLRCLVGFPSELAAAMTLAQAKQLGVSA